MKTLPYGVIFERDLGDGRVLHVLPLLFGQARLGIGRPDCSGYDDIW